MLSLFFSRLLSYFLFGRDEEEGLSSARETTLTFSVMYLFPLTTKVYLLVKPFQSYMLYLFFSGLLEIIFGRDKE